MATTTFMPRGPSSSTTSLDPGITSPKPQHSFTLPLPAASVNPWLTRAARLWDSSSLVLRHITIPASLALIATCLRHEHAQQSDPTSDYTPFWILAFPAFAALLWDLASALVLLARHGRAVPPKAQIGCELIVLLAALAGVGIYAWLVSGLLSWPGYIPTFHEPYVVAFAVLGGILVFARIAFFVRACTGRGRELRVARPRVMYVPATGAVVYLLARPRRRPGEMELLDHMDDSRAAAAAAAPPPADVIAEEEWPPARREEIPLAAPEPARSRGLMSPPPDDYVPDEAELERRRRGDAQPQLILPGDVALKFPPNMGDMSAGAAFAVEGKVLVWPARPDGYSSPRPVSSPRRRSWG